MSINFANKDSVKDHRLFLFQGEKKHIDFIESESKSKLDLISTGRFHKWKLASIHVINSKIKNIIFGNGPEFDRKIITTKGNDAGNGFIYVLLCGGVLGLFFLFITISKYLKIILKIFNNRKNLDYDIYFYFSIICITSLGLRSLVENGFLVYGVDFLLITSSFFYAAKKLELS